MYVIVTNFSEMNTLNPHIRKWTAHYSWLQRSEIVHYCFIGV